MDSSSNTLLISEVNVFVPLQAAFGAPIYHSSISETLIMAFREGHRGGVLSVMCRPGGARSTYRHRSKHSLESETEK